MRRRPLCVVLVCMILGIFCNAWINTKEPVSYERESIHFLCELEEFVKKDNGYTLVVHDVKGEDSFSCKKIKLYANENTAMPKELHIGNLLAVTASIHSFEKPGNPGQFDEYKYNTELGITAQGFAGKIEIKKNTVKNPEDFLHRLRNHLQDVVSLCCDEKTAGIVSAMVLGDKSGLSDEVKQLYQENGIAHVLAISGVKTLKLDIPLVPETRIKWAFVPLYIAIIYILKLCLDEEIIPRCRFPCSRGYHKKHINWQKKQ